MDLRTPQAVGRVEAGSGVCDSRGGEVAWPERDEVVRELS